MLSRKRTIPFLLTLVLYIGAKAQNDSLTLSEHSKHETEYKVKPLQLVVPSLLVGLGVVGLESD